MKFLCVKCDQVMSFTEKDDPDDGTMAISFKCGQCGYEVVMLTNPGETQMVHSLGVSIGHERLTPEPMGLIRNKLAHQPAIGESEAWEPAWTEAAERRLSAAPAFVQGMVRKLYTDYARQHGYREITPQIMNEAREALGMTGM
jgi:hypothetical protein